MGRIKKLRSKVIFEFEIEEKKYNNGMDARIKIDQNGYPSLLIKESEKWITKKGDLLKLKLTNGKI